MWESRLKEWKSDIVSYLDERDYLSLLGEDDRRDLLVSASKVFNEPAFKKIVEEMINMQAYMSILKTPDQMADGFHRAAIYSLFELMEEFKKLDASYKEEFSEKEEFNRNEII